MARDATADARLRFHPGLADLVPSSQRGRTIAVACAPSTTVKHLVESLGVPHTEVDLIRVNGEPSGFDARVRPAARIAVYPALRATDRRAPLHRVREPLPADPRFVADAHLGGLARLLRLSGFDTCYDNRFADDKIARLATDEARIVLTRDKALLMRRAIVHGRYVRAVHPPMQWREVVDRFGLVGAIRPFALCLVCNTPLRDVPKAAVVDSLPPRVREGHERFRACDTCGRVYWEGSHWRRLRARLDALHGVHDAAGQAAPASHRTGSRPGR